MRRFIAALVLRRSRSLFFGSPPFVLMTMSGKALAAGSGRIQNPRLAPHKTQREWRRAVFSVESALRRVRWMRREDKDGSAEWESGDKSPHSMELRNFKRLVRSA